MSDGTVINFNGWFNHFLWEGVEIFEDKKGRWFWGVMIESRRAFPEYEFPDEESEEENEKRCKKLGKNVPVSMKTYSTREKCMKVVEYCLRKDSGRVGRAKAQAQEAIRFNSKSI